MASSTQNSKDSLEPGRLPALPLPNPWAEGWSAHLEFACGGSYCSSDISATAMLILEAIRAAYVEEGVNLRRCS